MLWVHQILGWCNLLFILSIPLAFVLMTPRWWVFTAATLIFVLINLIQGEINPELSARVLAVSRKLRIERRQVEVTVKPLTVRGGLEPRASVCPLVIRRAVEDHTDSTRRDYFRGGRALRPA